VAAITGVVAAFSASALASASYSALPTPSQVAFMLSGSVLAGCLAASAQWLASPRTDIKKKLCLGIKREERDFLTGFTELTFWSSELVKPRIRGDTGLSLRRWPSLG
jgi:hypothetical protein